jgi:ankyrin repeat protein
MKPWKFFGPNTKLTKVAQLIMDEDVKGLDARLGKDWHLNRPFEFCEYVEDLAINLALIENKPKVIDYLLAKKADLNVEDVPAITFAARNSNEATIEKLLAAGAKLDAENNVGSNAYSCALYSDRFDLLPFLLRRGLKVDADGGKAFRQAVFGGQREAVEFFLDNGIDPNAQVADMVHPNAPSAVQVAALAGNLPMVKLLVERGADPTKPDNTGMRPYLVARSEKMRDYLRALEPAEWHDPAVKRESLKRRGVPDALIAFLEGAHRRIDIDPDEESWIELHTLTGAYDMHWQDDTFVALHSESDDNYGGGMLVWWPKKKCLAFIDEEHDEITKLGTWEAFLADPAAAVAKQWED